MRDNEFWRLNSSYGSRLSYHQKPNHRPGTIERFKLLSPGENLKDLFLKHSPDEITKLQEARVLPAKWYIQRNQRLVARSLSATVTSHCLDELVHPKQNRALSVREVARLQSFPDAYDFKGGPFICPHMYETQDKYEQVGDAIPPLMAYYLGLAISKALNNCS